MQTEGTMEKEICTIDEGGFKGGNSMTGYFEIKTYCELAGVSENTAYVRRLRGSIPYVIGENGLYYLYFTNDEKPLDGYVSLRTYAAKHGIDLRTLSTAVYKKRFKEGETIYCRKPNSPSKARRWYIREDAEYPKDKHKELGKALVKLRRKKHRDLCPYDEGYITVNEWAELNNMRLSTARVYAYLGKIPTKRIDGFVYIPKDYVYSLKIGANKQ